MSRLALGVAAATVALGFACGAALADATPAFTWLLGADLNSGTIGQVSGATDVYVGNFYGGTAALDLSGATFVRQATDSFFEFEHSADEQNSMLLPETTDGAPTPMTIGKADGQDVTSFIVAGSNAITGDLQSWQLGASTPSGIDANGRMRLNGIVLQPTLRNGRIELEAILPDGSTQILVPASS